MVVLILLNFECVFVCGGQSCKSIETKEFSLIDCTGKRLSRIPLEEIPVNVKVYLLLDNNNISCHELIKLQDLRLAGLSLKNNPLLDCSCISNMEIIENSDCELPTLTFLLTTGGQQSLLKTDQRSTDKAEIETTTKSDRRSTAKQDNKTTTKILSSDSKLYSSRKDYTWIISSSILTAVVLTSMCIAVKCKHMLKSRRGRREVIPLTSFTHYELNNDSDEEIIFSVTRV
jgi:hypothetical protein